MTFTALSLKPGINVEETRLLNSAGWSLGDGVRFFQGMAQKKGGWTALNTTALTGISRGLHGWADLVGNPYIASGSAQMLQIFSRGTIYDITPLRATDNVAVQFSTINGSDVVTIKDVGNQTISGDYVSVGIPVSVAGIVLYGDYEVQTVVDDDYYTVSAASVASATITDGGAVPVFDTTLSSTDVTVTLDNHGLAAGALWTVDVETSVGGFILLGSYAVVSSTTDTFVIQPGGTASATQTVAENSGNAQLQYLVHTGAVSAYYAASAGYGSGAYGAGPYGVSSSALTLIRPRLWFLDHYGQDLIANYTGSPLYVWDPSGGPSTRALELNTTNFPSAASPPTTVNISFVLDQQQMVVCMGCDSIGGSFDPNLIRWSDLTNFTDWYPTTTNQAGSFRVPSGSRVIGGIVAPNLVVFWTDVDMWIMSYIGGQSSELVWSFTKIAEGVDLIAPHAVGLLQGKVYWPSYNGFYVFDGASVQEVVCPVWDKFWANLDKTQIDKVNIQCNSVFNEISWGFPSASGSGEIDQCITMALDERTSTANYDTYTWTYDENPIWARTSWINNNVYGPPVGADVNGILDQHETSNDASGSVLASSATSGWFAASEGSILTMMERLSADLFISGGSLTVQITVYAQNYPAGPVRIYGPFDWVYGTGPPYSIVRARARFFSIKISSSTPGVFWRLGHLRFMSQQAGRRP